MQPVSRSSMKPPVFGERPTDFVAEINTTIGGVIKQPVLDARLIQKPGADSAGHNDADPLPYHKCGFTLLNLSELASGDPDLDPVCQKQLEKEILAHIKRLHPDADEILLENKAQPSPLCNKNRRGGKNGLKVSVLADKPFHVDFTFKIKEYMEHFGMMLKVKFLGLTLLSLDVGKGAGEAQEKTFVQEVENQITDASCITRSHREQRPADFVLGLWKPVNMRNPVRDNVLCFADPQSVDFAKDVYLWRSEAALSYPIANGEAYDHPNVFYEIEKRTEIVDSGRTLLDRRIYTFRGVWGSFKQLGLNVVEALRQLWNSPCRGGFFFGAFGARVDGDFTTVTHQLKHTAGGECDLDHTDQKCRQMVYYFSNQTCREACLFRHNTAGENNNFVNFHGGVGIPSVELGPDEDARESIEWRVGVWLKNAGSSSKKDD